MLNPLEKQLVKALEKIIANAPDRKPTEEEYDDTESAYYNGLDVANWEAAKIAKRALAKARRKETTNAAA